MHRRAPIRLPFPRRPVISWLRYGVREAAGVLTVLLVPVPVGQEECRHGTVPSYRAGVEVPHIAAVLDS